MAVKQSYLDTKGKEEDVSIAKPLPVTDSRFQIQLGNVEGFELASLSGQSTALNKSFQDLTPTGGSQVLPVSAEEWEIVSTDANDASAGTGARTVVVRSLDANYVEQDTFVTLDGLTPVVLSNTHLRSRTAVVLTAGSDASNTNLGDLIIRVSGGGTERMRIPIGIGDCKSLLFTVPAGKTAFGQHIFLFCAKNADCTIRFHATPFGGATINGGDVSTYQSEQDFPIGAPIVFPEKTDIRVLAKSTNVNASALTVVDFLIVDNDQIVNAMAAGAETRNIP